MSIFVIRMLQIVGVKGPSWSENGYANPNSNNTFDGCQGETDLWAELDTDLYHWTKALRPVQVFIYVPIYLPCVCVVVASLQNLGLLILIPGYWAVVSWSYCKSRKRTEGTAQVDGCCHRGAGWTNSYVHKSSTGKFFFFCWWILFSIDLVLTWIMLLSCVYFLFSL